VWLLEERQHIRISTKTGVADEVGRVFIGYCDDCDDLEQIIELRSSQSSHTVFVVQCLLMPGVFSICDDCDDLKKQIEKTG
jgi:hypothetical protein